MHIIKITSRHAKEKKTKHVSSMYPFITLCSMFNQKNTEEYGMRLGK